MRSRRRPTCCAHAGYDQGGFGAKSARFCNLLTAGSRGALGYLVPVRTPNRDRESYGPTTRRKMSSSSWSAAAFKYAFSRLSQAMLFRGIITARARIIISCCGDHRDAWSRTAGRSRRRRAIQDRAQHHASHFERSTVRMPVPVGAGDRQIRLAPSRLGRADNDRQLNCHCSSAPARGSP
jgi:hypothetical protein